MKKVFSILLSLSVLFLALSALVSCNPTESEDDVPYVKGTKRGEYKIEMSISGDIEGFKPAILFRGYYYKVTQSPNNLLFDGEGKDLGTLEGFYGYSYEDLKDSFSKTITCYTTKKAYGLGVSIQYTNHETVLQEPSPTIFVTYKGYLNGKLIKEETQKANFWTANNHIFSHSEFWIGTTYTGSPASVW